MKNKLLLLSLLVFLYCFSSGNAVAQRSINEIRIDQCIDSETNKRHEEATANIQDPVKRQKELDRLNSEWWLSVIEGDAKRGLVLDARPFAINQSTGKIRFDGKTGRVSVAHMNPFVYQYHISVNQEELVSTAVSDFINILLPEALRSIGKTNPEGPNARSIATMPGNLSAISGRLSDFTKECTDTDPPGCKALKAMKDDFDLISPDVLGPTFVLLAGSPPDEISKGTQLINDLRDDQADAYTTCTRAHRVNEELAKDELPGKIDALKDLQRKLDDATAIAKDLDQLADQYLADDDLKAYTFRCGGFLCAGQFKLYATAVQNLFSNVYQPTLNNRLDTWQQFQAMLALTNGMKEKEGVFARTFEIKKKFELSQATVTVARVELKPKDNANTESARTNAAAKQDTSAQNNHAAADPKEDKKSAKADDAAPDKPRPVTPDINESIQIGRPRFLVSGGLVYSPLSRQSFVTTSGFARDAQGNPTGDGNKSVVGFDENSPRRLLPMVFLNSRLASFSPASIYFTLGVTAKKDKDIDVEYLIGPSVSMLNDRAMFTFGAYAGKGERLVPNVKIGDEIPKDAGSNALVATKHYTWKPGFSFSYVFSNLTKKSQEGAGGGGGDGGSGSAANDLKDEIRIGAIHFNLAMGLAYTSLEDQTFAPILGFARDRQGNLTNGETLTRIVGLATTSNYRLVPLAMLHSRLFNFGRHSFYLTSGVTGKKEDNVELEYLLGGSVNIYRRKLFFTFGTFAGKQQVLAADQFLGNKLDAGQDPGITRRYVWKPAFAFSYDISKIVPGGAKN